MNDTVFFSYILLLCIDAIGLGVSFEFYRETKDMKFTHLLIGWSIWILGNFFPISLYFNENATNVELFFYLNALFISLGGIFMVKVLFSYFLKIPIWLYLILILITPIISILLFLYVDNRLSVAFLTITLNLITIWAILNIFLKRKIFKERLGKSIKWYYVASFLFLGYLPISIFLYFQGHTFSLYTIDNIFIIVLYYVITLSSTVLLIILLIHIEYSILIREKFDLKDKYSHSLGNTIQAIYTIIDLLDLKIDVDQGELKNLKKLLKEKLEEAGDTITEIRDL